MVGNVIYIHSKCHGAHWELVFDIQTKQYRLQCEKCGKPLGRVVDIVSNFIPSRCSRCG